MNIGDRVKFSNSLNSNTMALVDPLPMANHLAGLASLTSLNKSPPSSSSIGKKEYTAACFHQSRVAKTSHSPVDICMPIISGAERNFNRLEHKDPEHDVHHPLVVTNRVKRWVSMWGKVLPISPEVFFQNILRHRGYDYEYIPHIRNRSPSPEQIADYDNELVWAIRYSDLEKIKLLQAQGKSMSACNKYSESIVHMACRRSTPEVIQFIIDHGGDFTIVDDYGRTPLHDAMWRPEPRFDIVAMICNANLDLLRCTDVRGYIPLNYVREEDWVEWCAFLFNQIEKYWAPMPPGYREEERERAFKRTRRERPPTVDGNCHIPTTFTIVPIPNSSSSQAASALLTVKKVNPLPASLPSSGSDLEPQSSRSSRDNNTDDSGGETSNSEEGIE